MLRYVHRVYNSRVYRAFLLRVHTAPARESEQQPHVNENNKT